MLSDDLVEIHRDLEWSLFEIRLQLGVRDDAIARTESALARLSAVIAMLMSSDAQMQTKSDH